MTPRERATLFYEQRCIQSDVAPDIEELLIAEFEAAVLEEREECACLCVDVADLDPADRYEAGFSAGADVCAQRIRSRT